MSTKTKFIDVQNYFQKHNVIIDRDKSDLCNVTATIDRKTHKLYCRLAPSQFLSEAKKHGVPGFMSLYDANNPNHPQKRSKLNPKVSKPRKTKSTIKTPIDVNRPLALEKRRQQMEASKTSVTVNPQTYEVSMEEGVVSMADAVETKVINYMENVPKEFTQFNKTYYFPEITKNILLRLQMGRNIFISGRTGTGKSDFVNYLAQHVGQKVLRVNFSVGTTERHLMGKHIVKDGRTQFVYGIVPTAMKLGWWILFDEIDYAQPEHLSCIQSVLEGNSVLLTDNENEEVIPHENFRCFATANTKGRGDESQSYVGTNFLNLAFLDRWSFFELGYTSKENKIVQKLLQKDVELQAQVMQFFKVLRKAVDDGMLMNLEFSTRRIEQFSEMLAFGESIKDALEYELCARYDKHEAQIINEIAYGIWDRQHYFSGDWFAGDAHCSQPAPQKP